MEIEKLSVLHEHYRDSCEVLQRARTSRDLVFYFILLVLAIALYDTTAPQGFASTIADVMKAKLELSTTPDLAYIRSLLWFLLLGMTARYAQTALAVERHYVYIHSLETTLAAEVPGGFKREGEAYLSDYPLFLTWAHYLYTFVFPTLLIVVVIGWTWQQVPGVPWRAHWSMWLWFNVAITVAILASVGLYLQGFQKINRRQDAREQQAKREAVNTEDTA